MSLATATSAIRASDNTAFAMEVWRAIQRLQSHALRLWSWDYHGAEDGLQEAVCRAIANRHKFDGRNLVGWLNRLLRNIRCDQLAKGYGKDRRNPARSKRPQDGPQGRLLFYGNYDAVKDQLHPMADLCDPESILIATEEYHDHTRER